jgi:predicted phage tail protein
MNTIRVYGQLAKCIGQRVFKAAINTPVEAFRFLAANYPQVKQHILSQWYAIYIGDYRLTGYEQLNDPLGAQELRIVPVFSGEIRFRTKAEVEGTQSKSSSSNLITGGLVALGGAILGTIIGGDIGRILTIGAVGAGLAYASSALTQPAPQVGVAASPLPIAQSKDPRANFSFNGVQNTSRAGVPVPIVYGEVITGSVVISAGLDTVQVKG